MKKNIIHSLIFWIIVAVLYLSIQRVFYVKNVYTRTAKMMFNGYYELEKNTVDAVAIGNSHIYRYIQGAFAYKQNGLAVIPLSTAALPCSMYRDLAVEALKTQSPKVLVFDVWAFAGENNSRDSKMYFVLENMKYSWTYFSIVKEYCDCGNIPLSERAPYYFPLVKFHSRWQELDDKDFKKPNKSYLNSCYNSSFMKDTKDTDRCNYVETVCPIGEEEEKALNDLLDWCNKQKDFEIEFVAEPLIRAKEERLGMINYIGEKIEAAGYTFINYNEPEAFDEFGFDIKKDFKDINHVNIRGSYKYCELYGKHLMEEYGLKDHRGEEKYSEWDKLSEKYIEKIGKHLSYE